MVDVNEILRKYTKQIRREITAFDSSSKVDFTSNDYQQFKKDMMPEMSRYEKYSKAVSFKVKLAIKDELRMQREIDVAHLDLTPGEVVGTSVATGFLAFFVVIMSCFGFWYVSGGFLDINYFPWLLFFLGLMTSFFLAYYFYTLPARLATKWRLKASSQMMPAILYTVIYMKHTSNLERAMNFVSKNIEAPLALDLKKVLWEVETGKYSNIKESLDKYLDFWKDNNPEFIESFHLIESSLFEPSEDRRVQILERALKVILDGVYEGMLKYTHDIKSPLTNLYMLGIVLPTLSLALLPLVSTLLGGMIKSIHIFLMFNLIIPFFVFYLTLQIMLKRPGGYGESSFLEKNKKYEEYTSNRPYYLAALIAIPLLIIGLLPFIMHIDYLTYNIHNEDDSQALLKLKSDYTFEELGLGFFQNGYLFNYQLLEDNTTEVGPFGVGALLLSLFVPFSVGIFFSFSFMLRTKNLIKSRDDTKMLEKEFSSSLFTLGNRIGDGVPPEIAISRVAESTKGQRTSDFFRLVNVNIQSMGMSVENAVFNSQRGAIIYYPSGLIATSMRILVESSKKGLQVAAQSLMSISEYVGNINKINERLRDLLAEVVSDMSSNMTFLAPLLSGIVVGLASMITGILGNLKNLVDIGGGDGTLGGLGSISEIVSLFDIVNMIPPYFLQVAIGLYIIEIIFILTGTLVTIDAGEDKLKQTYEISRNLVKGSFLYLIIALISIVSLSFLATIALSGIAG